MLVVLAVVLKIVLAFRVFFGMQLLLSQHADHVGSERKHSFYDECMRNVNFTISFFIGPGSAPCGAANPPDISPNIICRSLDDNKRHPNAFHVPFPLTIFFPCSVHFLTGGESLYDASPGSLSRSCMWRSEDSLNFPFFALITNSSALSVS